MPREKSKVLLLMGGSEAGRSLENLVVGANGPGPAGGWSSEDWYHAEDVLHVENTIANATQHFRDAQAQGWARVRVCGSPRLTGNDREWLTCLQYEQHLHRMVTEMETLVLCAYRRGSLSDQIKDGLLQTHHMALERQGDGCWYRPTVS